MSGAGGEAVAGSWFAQSSFATYSLATERNVVRVAGDGVQYAFDTTGVPSVILTAVSALRPTGVCGLVGVQVVPLTIEPNLLSTGRNMMGIVEGDAVPQVFIPQMIDLWRQGRFPFDRLVETFPFSRIDEAEASSLAGGVVKPVLLTNGAAA